MNNDLISSWIDWNEKRITADDFCMLFEKIFRSEIRNRINLRLKIKKQMVVEK